MMHLSSTSSTFFTGGKTAKYIFGYFPGSYNFSKQEFQLLRNPSTVSVRCKFPYIPFDVSQSRSKHKFRLSKHNGSAFPLRGSNFDIPTALPSVLIPFRPSLRPSSVSSAYTYKSHTVEILVPQFPVLQFDGDDASNRHPSA